MYTITKEFAFSASHQLAGLPAEHPCSRLHGHNYVVEVDLQAERLDPDVGFVVDYHALAGVKRWLDEQWDHQHLNDRMDGNPTAERMAEVLFTLAAPMVRAELQASGWVATDGWQLAAVRVRETPKTCAEFRP